MGSYHMDVFVCGWVLLLCSVLVLFLIMYAAIATVGSDSQDARAIHGSCRSAMVHLLAFVMNGLRLVVVATPG